MALIVNTVTQLACRRGAIRVNASVRSTVPQARVMLCLCVFTAIFTLFGDNDFHLFAAKLIRLETVYTIPATLLWLH